MKKDNLDPSVHVANFQEQRIKVYDSIKDETLMKQITSCAYTSNSVAALSLKKLKTDLRELFADDDKSQDNAPLHQAEEANSHSANI